MTFQPGSRTAGRPFTGRHMALLMVGFFGTIIGVNGLLAVLSSTSWSGLVVQNSYVASQEYQEKRDAMAVQHALGWVPSLDVSANAARFTVNDANGAPVDLGTVTVQINRPVGTRGDRSLTLAPAADRSYVAELALAPGAWDVLVTATTATGPFEYHQRVTVETAGK